MGHGELRVLLALIGALLLSNGARSQADEATYKAVGSEVTLVPVFSGSPTEINWKVDGHKLVDMEMNPLHKLFYRLRERATINERNGELTIRNLNKGDTGAYKAEALVNNVIQETNINLKVLECPAKPTISNRTMEGYIIELRCESSTPNVKYKWLDKTRVLSTSQTYNVSQTIENVTLTCVVSNEACENNVTVIIPPIPVTSTSSGYIFVIVIVVILIVLDFLIIFIPRIFNPPEKPIHFYVYIVGIVICVLIFPTYVIIITLMCFPVSCLARRIIHFFPWLECYRCCLPERIIPCFSCLECCRRKGRKKPPEQPVEGETKSGGDRKKDVEKGNEAAVPLLPNAADEPIPVDNNPADEPRPKDKNLGAQILVVANTDLEKCGSVSLKMVSVGNIQSMVLCKVGVLSVSATLVEDRKSIKCLCLTLDKVENPEDYTAVITLENGKTCVSTITNPNNIAEITRQEDGIKLTVPIEKEVKEMALKKGNETLYGLSVEGPQLKINDITLEAVDNFFTVKNLKPKDSGIYKVDLHATEKSVTTNKFNLEGNLLQKKSQDNKKEKLTLCLNPPEEGCSANEIGSITFHLFEITNNTENAAKAGDAVKANDAAKAKKTEENNKTENTDNAKKVPVTWKKGDQPVDTSKDKFQISPQGDLIVNNVASEDEGSYTVYLKDQEMIKEFRLRLEGWKPGA